MLFSSAYLVSFLIGSGEVSILDGESGSKISHGTSKDLVVDPDPDLNWIELLQSPFFVKT